MSARPVSLSALSQGPWKPWLVLRSGSSLMSLQKSIEPASTAGSSELWLPYPGHPGQYEVSDQGRVRSKRGRILKPNRDTRGYMQVALYYEGRKTTMTVHRLVLEAFVGPAPEGTEVCHGNGARDDNRAVNLRWGTRSENTYDKVSHGTHNMASKEACKRGHPLTPDNVLKYNRERGTRGCRACSLGRTWLRRHPGSNRTLQDISDQYYANR
jgi:HNH endonuclease/NUMOD4 motif